MKRRTKALLIIGMLVFCWLLGALIPRTPNYALENPLRGEGGLPLIIAHGGGNGEFPDNTLEAMYNAYSIDCNVVMEMDVNITKDGVLILSHDSTLDRKTNVTGSIADWTYEELLEQRVNFGYTNPVENGCLAGERALYTDGEGRRKLPTDVSYPEGVSARDSEIYLVTAFEEVLLAFPETRMIVEIKQGGETGFRALGELMRLLEKHDAWGRVVAASFHEEIYDEFQRLQAEGAVPECFMYSPSYDASIAFFVLQLLKLDGFFPDGLSSFQLPTEEYGISLSTKGFVGAAHRNNIAVHYWTVNDPDEMRRLVEIGADGIITDYPGLLKEVLASLS